MNILPNPYTEGFYGKYFEAIRHWQEIKERGGSKEDLERANWKIGQIKRIIEKRREKMKKAAH